MITIGVDFGIQKVGVAISDSRGKIAFPHAVVPAKEAVAYIHTLATEKCTTECVVGDMRDYSGEESVDGAQLHSFVAALQERGMHVVLVSEYGTTGAAGSYQEGSPRGDVQSPRRDTSARDARAAALILQRHLDTHPEKE